MVGIKYKIGLAYASPYFLLFDFFLKLYYNKYVERENNPE